MREKVYTVVFMVVISAAFTGLVSGVNLLCRERVRLNQHLAEKRVQMAVLGIRVPEGAGLQEVDDLYARSVFKTGRFLDPEAEEGAILAHRPGNEGPVLGYVFGVGGRGFWDVIRGYMAVSPDLKEVVGLAFYQQSETPGLGAEITRPWFMNQFAGLAIPDAPDADGFYIRLRRADEEMGRHDVEAVTGATGTSTAVQRFINKDLGRFLHAMEGGTPG